jgi:hypothetical protein
MKHTASIEERMGAGVSFMQSGLSHLAEAEKRMQIMSKLMVSEDEEINFLKLAYDRPLDEDLHDWRNWKNIEPIFLAPKGGQYSKGTLWNSYNVLTEFEDHHSRINRNKGQDNQLSPTYVTESRQVRALFGANTVNRKVKGFKIADAVIRGDLDLKTGRQRDRESRKTWVAATAGLMGTLGLQHLMNF